MLDEEMYFGHETLDVYRDAIAFVAWLSPYIDAATNWGDTRDQLDRASTSISRNIAEGNGKYTAKDRCRFFDIAHGSALECAAALDTLVAKGRLTAAQVRPGKETLQRIVRRLMGLIKKHSDREYIKGAVPNS